LSCITLSSSQLTDPASSPDFDSLPIALRKGTRSYVTKHPIGNFVSYQSLSASFSCFISMLSSVSSPKTVQDALYNSGWRKAIELQMQAIHQNKTWELVPLPSGKHNVGCKWVYNIKYHLYGYVDRLKARLVAKGYTQVYGVNYDETFSPVAKISNVHVLVSLAANPD
jgi:hypothetical protein